MQEFKKKTSINVPLSLITIIPLLLIALIITGVSASMAAKGMNQEVQSGLKDLESTISTLYEEMFPGDYVLQEQDGALYLSKGEHLLNGDYAIIDRIKQETGNDITLFYQDVSIITTICDANGERYIGASANPIIVEEVINQQTSKFYEKMQLNGNNYYAYYAPIFNSDGTCIGMFFIAKPTMEVNASVRRTVVPGIVIAIVGTLIALFFAVSYSQKIIKAIRQVEEFLSKVASGNLTANINPEVLRRDDELGEMGRYAVHMQHSLKNLISVDTLTQLTNRSYGEKRLIQIRDKALHSGMNYAVAIGDIDFFKKVNDTYGHECGDVVLKHVSQIMKRFMTGNGIVARWGGEEFLLVFDKDDAVSAGEKLNQMLEEIRGTGVNYDNQHIKVTMTFGIVNGSQEQEIDNMLKAADLQLYEGKLHGRNQVVVENNHIRSEE